MSKKDFLDHNYNELKERIVKEGQVFVGWKNCRTSDRGYSSMIYILEKAGYVKVDWEHPIECRTPYDIHDFGGGQYPYYALRVEVVKELP